MEKGSGAGEAHTPEGDSMGGEEAHRLNDPPPAALPLSLTTLPPPPPPQALPDLTSMKQVRHMT